jgi:hypothetical protein
MKKALIRAVFAAFTAISLAVPALANTGETSVAEVMQTGFTNLRAELMPIIGIALGSGLMLFGIFFGIRKGISLLRRVSGG